MTGSQWHGRIEPGPGIPLVLTPSLLEFLKPDAMEIVLGVFSQDSLAFE